MGLVADDDDDPAAEVDVGERAAVLVGADDPVAVGVRVLDDRAPVRAPAARSARRASRCWRGRPAGRRGRPRGR